MRHSYLLANMVEKEPLHAVYKRDVMLGAIESALEEGSRSILSPGCHFLMM